MSEMGRSPRFVTISRIGITSWLQVINAEEGLFFLGVVGLGCDGYVLIGMHFDSRK